MTDNLRGTFPSSDRGSGLHFNDSNEIDLFEELHRGSALDLTDEHPLSFDHTQEEIPIKPCPIFVDGSDDGMFGNTELLSQPPHKFRPHQTQANDFIMFRDE
jgi:hypothetical protein